MADPRLELARLRFAANQAIDEPFARLADQAEQLVLARATTAPDGTKRLSASSVILIRSDLLARLMAMRTELTRIIVAQIAAAEALAVTQFEATGPLESPTITREAITAAGIALLLTNAFDRAIEQVDRVLLAAVVQRTDVVIAAERIGLFFDPAFAARRTGTGRLIRSRKPAAAPRWPAAAGNGSAGVRLIAGHEINGAHGAQTVKLGAGTDGYGIRWTLSPWHKRHDECCVAGTMVETISGPKPIESIGLGERVLTHKGNYRAVTKLFHHAIPEESLVQLHCQADQSRTHSVTLTRNHPVLTDRGWVAAGDLQMGSPLVALVSAPFLVQPQSPGDPAHKASQGSDENAKPPDSGKAGAERCDEDERRQPRRSNNAFPDWIVPTRPHRFAFGISRRHLARRTSLGLLIVGGLLRIPPLLLVGADTFPNSGFQSCCLPHPTKAHTLSNRIAVRDMRQTRHRRFHRLWDRWRVLQDSRRLNRTSFRALFDSAERKMSFGTPGNQARSASLLPGPRTGDCRNDALPHGLDGRGQTVSEGSDFRTIHTVLAYVNCNIPGSQSPLKTHVYNLAVDSDNSYFADGLAVHNCDSKAEFDSGLGSGVYLPDDVPSHPSHGMCYCTLVPVKLSEIAA